MIEWVVLRPAAGTLISSARMDGIRVVWYADSNGWVIDHPIRTDHSEPEDGPRNGHIRTNISNYTNSSTFSIKPSRNVLDMVTGWHNRSIEQPNERSRVDRNVGHGWMHLRIASQVRRLECDEIRNRSSRMVWDGWFDGLDGFNHHYWCLVDDHNDMLMRMTMRNRLSFRSDSKCEEKISFGPARRFVFLLSKLLGVVYIIAVPQSYKTSYH